MADDDKESDATAWVDELERLLGPPYTNRRYHHLLRHFTDRLDPLTPSPPATSPNPPE